MKKVLNENYKLILPFFQIPDYRNAVIVAKNPLAARRATSYAERLRLNIAVIHGEVKEGDEEEPDGRASPPPLNALDVADVASHVKLGSSFDYSPGLVTSKAIYVIYSKLQMRKKFQVKL